MPPIRPQLVLAALALCALGFAMLAATVVPHAERVLEVASGLATGLLIAGACSVAGVVAGLRVAPERRRSALLVGVLVLGAGLLSATVGRALPGLVSALVPAAIGMGLVATLAVRLVGATAVTGLVAASAGVLLARVLADAGLSYRGVFAVGGFLALSAAVPVVRLGGAVRPATLRAVRTRGVLFAGATAALLLVALIVHGTGLLEADKAAFEAMHGLGSTPELVETIFVEPNLRNYVVIVLVVGLLGARLWGTTTPLRTLLLVAGAGCVAYAGVRTCWALWERPRPEEVLGVAPVNGHSWAPYPSFPSGHMAVTAALALATAMLVPKLRYVLWTYAAIIAFTRLSYGAHFPSDVLLGFAMGWLAAVVTVTPLGVPVRLPRMPVRARMRRRQLAPAE